MDDDFKENGGGKYWYELLGRIRDIRSSEKVLYRQVLDLYATSIDYNPKALESIKFFKIVQNKLHYAAHGNTAAEVIARRANAGKPFMGLLAFSSGKRKQKRYRHREKLSQRGRVENTEQYRFRFFFDLAEVRVMKHEPMYMKDWIAQLDKLIGIFDKKILTESGSVSHAAALKKAAAEYKKYQSKTISEVEKAYLETIKTVQKTVEKKVRETKRTPRNDLRSCRTLKKFNKSVFK